MKFFRSKVFLSIAWLVFTVAFAGWWFYFSYNNLTEMAKVEPQKREQILSQKRMIMSEGVSWIILLAAGGGTLIYFVVREKKRTQQVKEFFASFSHDVKTSLASLRLQAETLKEDIQEASPVLDRLVGDTVRLQLQLENSLYFAAQDSLRLFVEPLNLNKAIDRVALQWPYIVIHKGKDSLVKADERALQSVLSNLIQNAIVHGGATEVSFLTKEHGTRHVEIHFADNGKGFQGESMETLGRLFHRATSKSGSGLGLYICHRLLEKMNGKMIFLKKREGFGGYFTLEGNMS